MADRHDGACVACGTLAIRTHRRNEGTGLDTAECFAITHRGFETVFPAVRVPWLDRITKRRQVGMSLTHRCLLRARLNLQRRLTPERQSSAEVERESNSAFKAAAFAASAVSNDHSWMT